VNSISHDLKYAVRQMGKNPAFTGIAVLTLALAVGVNAAVFAVLYRVALKPLPFPESDRLVQLNVRSTETGQADLDFTAREFEILKARCQGFDSLAGVSGEICNLYGMGEPVRVFGARVTPQFLSTYGITPILGRVFAVDDYQLGGNPVVLISHRLWQEQFGRRADVLGRTIQLEGTVAVVCGVMPADFRMPSRLTMYWRPLVLTPEELQDTEERHINVVARLSPDVSLKQLPSRLEQLARRVQAEMGIAEADRVTLAATPLLKQRLGSTSRILWILFGAVSCVTLIGTANLINLHISDLIRRRKEFAIRLALGAGVRRIYRQGFIESCLLSLGAGVLGMMLAVACISLLRSRAPWGLPRAEEIAPDVTIMGYGFALSLVMGVCVSLIPLARLLKSIENNSTALKCRDSGGAFTGRRARPWLVTSQVTVATTLLIGAGLFWSSFRNILRTDPGFAPEYLLTARIVPPHNMVDQDDTCRAFFRQLTDRLGALPELTEVGLVNSLPLSDINFKRPLHIENSPVATDGPVQGHYTRVSVNYFELMGIPLLAGRPFNPTDDNGAPTVIVSKSLAQRYFGDKEILGRRIKLGPGKWHPWMTIIGVVADVKTMGREAPSEPTFYVPCLQKDLPTYTMKGMFVVARTRTEPETAIARLRSELHALSPEVAMCNIETMQGRLDESVSDRRYHLMLMGVFAVLAWVLVMIGVFGVLSRIVVDRRREIGIRMALGSSQSRMFQLVLKQGLKPVALGIIAGWFLALSLHRVLSGLLFGISPSHPGMFLLVGVILMATATMACYLPARRAMKLNPMEVLRYE
jgi:putative ABC transport system permease protein